MSCHLPFLLLPSCSDLDESTKQVKFEVFDREKPPGGEYENIYFKN